MRPLGADGEVIWQISSAFHSLLSSPDGRYFCSIERKSNQKRPLVPKVRKLKNHRHSLHQLIFTLLFLLTLAVIFSQCLSVIVSVSPFCSEGGLFRTTLLLG